MRCDNLPVRRPSDNDRIYERMHTMFDLYGVKLVEECAIRAIRIRKEEEDINERGVDSRGSPSTLADIHLEVESPPHQERKTLCAWGGYHVWLTKNKGEVTCPACLVKIKKGQV